MTKRRPDAGPRILVTAFEPFGGRGINTSRDLLARIVAEPPASMTLLSEVLTVDEAGVDRMVQLVRGPAPDAVIALGEQKAPGLAVEHVAVNLRDDRIADNAGVQVRDTPVSLGGPAAYFASLPTRAMVDAAEAAGATARRSMSAGTFLCNAVMYAGLHAAAAMDPVPRVGFVHVGAIEETAPTADAATALDELATGLRAMLDVVADVIRTGGDPSSAAAPSAAAPSATAPTAGTPGSVA